ncbi:S8 family peptidase [Microbulbifer rhizosphaerae]|uniref:Serine protease n=1 Tax=Microbulbifer rhizosphaerae TaxID=1562603 RepID=A0A7W4WE83_9GAMM|nr:S8 family peptidase [Microbulbifer rhizosphaerae]MBB3062615.1 serine protease [Microbulbifer rhizosphaerae]
MKKHSSKPSNKVLPFFAICALACSAGALAAPDPLAGKMNLPALQAGQNHQRFIVKYREGAAERASLAAGNRLLNAVAAETGSELNLVRRLATGADLVGVPGGLDGAAAEALMRRFARDPDVAYVEPDIRLTTQFTPDDSRYSEQWHYYEPTAGLNLPGAWDKADGSGAVVAVVDTGYTDHSDLLGNIIGGYDFISDSATARDGNGRDSDAHDEGDWYGWFECGIFPASSSWHGTHVAGTVAALTDNSQGVAGVAFNAKVVPVRVLGKCGGSLSDIADAIVWASGGSVSGVPANPFPADVINMSLGGSGACGATFQDAIDTAVGNGAAVVVAAGNSNADASGFQPASCNNVISVAATDRQGNRASYSNYGSVVDVAAPGGETASTANGVLSTLNSGSQTPSSESYAFYQGTSMATPHVAGLAALVRSVDPDITPAELEAEIKANARAFAGSCSQCGSGLADADATVTAVMNP